MICTKTSFSMEFPATLEHLYEMLGFIKHHAMSVSFSSKQLHEIELSSEEALANIIQYGYPQSLGNIQIHCVLLEKGFKITFIDQGVSFNPLKSASYNRHLPLEDREVGGVGIHLLLNLMDKVEYKRIGNTNNLTFTKLL